MTGLYLGALGLGGVLLAAGWFMGGDADGDGASDGAAGFAVAVAGPLGSIRFWTFGSLAFGLTGLLSTLLGLPGPGAFGFAALTGLALGWGFFRAFRALAHEQVSAGTSVRDYVGSEARVLLTVGADRVGKIGVQRLSGRVELPARSGDGRSHAPGDEVSIVDVTAAGEAIVVSTRGT